MRRQRRLTQRLASKLSLSLAQSPVCSICARKFLRPTIALRTNFCAPSQMRQPNQRSIFHSRVDSLVERAERPSSCFFRISGCRAGAVRSGPVTMQANRRCRIRNLDPPRVKETSRGGEALAARIKRIITFFTVSLQMVGADVACEAVALADLATTCRLLERTPFDLLPLRHATFETAEAAAVLTQAAQEPKELRAERDRLAQAFALDTSPLVEELDIHVGVLEGANFLSPLFNSDYRQARRYFQKLSNIPAENHGPRWRPSFESCGNFR